MHRVIVVQDYKGVNGGASHIANLEVAAFSEGGITVQRVTTTGRVFSILFANFQLTFLLIVHPKRKVIVHTWSFFPTLILAYVINPSRICFVVHDYLLTCPSKARFDFNTNKNCELIGGGSKCLRANCGYSGAKKVVGAAFGALGRALVKKGARVRCLSFLSRSLLKNAGLSGRLTLLPNLYAWETEAKAVKDVALAPGTFILYAGRWTSDKGADRFLSLHSELRKVVAGADGVATEGCEFLGWVSPSQVKWLVSVAAAVVYPARQRDCDPLIVQECISVGVPVFVSSGNAAANLVKKVFGVHSVVEDWGELKLTKLLIEQCRENYCGRRKFTPSSHKLIKYYEVD